MGIERARVVEVHAPTSDTGRVGSGYLVTDRLVLTSAGLAGLGGTTLVRPAGTATWIPSSLVWSAGGADAALVEVDSPTDLMLPRGAMRWGRLVGGQPVPVTAMGFPPAGTRPHGFRDAQQFFGRLVPAASTSVATSLAVEVNGATSPPGEGMAGAALFAGAEIVGVLGTGPGGLAVPVEAFAGEEEFASWVGDGEGISLVPVTAPSFGFHLGHPAGR